LRRASYIFEVCSRFARDLFHGARCFVRPLRTFRSRPITWIGVYLGGRSVMNPFVVVAGDLALERRQLGAVLEHFANQGALRLDALALLEPQHGQNATRDDEKNPQQRQNCCRLGCCLIRCALSVEKDGQGSPQFALYAPGFVAWNSAPVKPYKWEAVSVWSEWIYWLETPKGESPVCNRLQFMSSGPCTGNQSAIRSGVANEL